MQIVNGYVCHDCTDVDLAKKNIDPAHPKDGPNRVEAKRRDEARKAAQPEELRLAISGSVGTRLHVLA